MITSSDPKPLLPARYQLKSASPLKGGFGSVWVVTDQFLGRDVLFKEIQDKKNNSQLLNEVQFLSRARSRHVVEIYDIVQDSSGNLNGIIMEYLTGRDYVNFSTDVRQNIPQFLKVLYQLASALADLHSMGVTHRDVKLGNLKESSSGILKIFDFGISSPSENYRTSENRGTFVYGAPELYIPNAETLPSADVYAFGVCAWELAAPSFPDSLRERPPQSKTAAPSIEVALSGLLPAEIVSTIDDCLRVDAESRPSSEKVRDIFKKYLIKGLHRGVFVQGRQQVFELSKAAPYVRIKIPGQGEIGVRYDELVYRVDAVVGDVYINNEPALVGRILPDSCLLTFGAPSLGMSREHIPFFSSHPEIIL